MGLGNLLSRVTRPRAWSVRAAVETAAASASDSSSVAPLDELPVVRAHADMLDGLAAAAAQQMDRLDPTRALHVIMDAVFEVTRTASPLPDLSLS